MIYQNDKRLKQEIQAIGCFYMDCLALAEIYSGKTFPPEEINSLWDECKKRKWINDKNEIVDCVSIINHALQTKGSVIMVRQNCFITDGSKYGNAEYYIQKAKILHPKKEPFHFRLMNKDAEIIYDSYNPPIDMGREVYKRGFLPC